LGYISWTKWPDSKSIRGLRLPPGTLFSITFVFEILQCLERILLSEINVFLFYMQPTSPDSLDTSPFSQACSAIPAPQGFSFSLSFTPSQRLYHVTCPPVTGFHPGPGEIWPVVSGTVSKILPMEMAPDGSKPEKSQELR
jgi:hypothetical protein